MCVLSFRINFNWIELIKGMFWSIFKHDKVILTKDVQKKYNQSQHSAVIKSNMLCNRVNSTSSKAAPII